MGLTRGLSEADAVFKIQADLEAADLRTGTTAAIQDGVSMKFFDIDTADSGLAIVLDNGLFANPVGELSNISLSELDNPLVHLYAKNDLVRVLNGATELSSDRNTVATRVDINGIVRDVAIDEPREEETGWLFEGDGENFALETIDYQDAVWSVDFNTGTKNFITGASGQNAVQFIASSQRPALSQPITLTAATTYTLSAVVEDILDIGNDRQVLAMKDLADASGALTALASEAVDGVLSITFTTGSDVTANLAFGIGTTQPATGDITLSQVQIELGSFRTSYMPTAATAVTRSADDQSFPSAENFRESEGAIFLNVDIIGDNGDTQSILNISDGTNDNRIVLTKIFDGRIRLLIDSEGIPQAKISTAFAMTPLTKFAIGINYSNNDVELFVDGVSIGKDTSVSLPVGMPNINVGQNIFNGFQLFGHIQDLRFYKKKRTLDEFRFLGSK